MLRICSLPFAKQCILIGTTVDIFFAAKVVRPNSITVNFTELQEYISYKLFFFSGSQGILYHPEMHVRTL